MPLLTIKSSGKDRCIPFSTGRSVREILDETDIRVRAGCNGKGACGLCRIRLIGDQGVALSPTELLTLDADLIAQGVRLACQVQVDNDMVIEIINPAPRSVWRRLEDDWPEKAGLNGGPAGEADSSHSLGAAIDVGTTHISIAVHDLATGRRLAGLRGLNPQAVAGSDVLTRLQAAVTGGQSDNLGRLVVRAIGEGLHDIGTREGIDLRRITRVVMAGNTAMLALLSGRNGELLLQPGYWSRLIDCRPLDTASWLDAWQIDPHGVIEVLPPVAGFVGSDLLSGVMATRLTEGGPGALFIDFGTNSEVALWDGTTLWVTSAAGGPAFEGCGMSCGMPADPGAIFRVHGFHGGGGMKYEVIGDAEPLGLCGTGMIDLLACLVREGIVNAKGQFVRPDSQSDFVLPLNGSTMAIGKKDVDTFQRAKAAIGVAVRILLAKAGLDYSQVQRLAIAGIFGQHLDIANAVAIGLLPVLPGIVETTGNAALAGCEEILLLPERKQRLEQVMNNAVMINLAACEDFAELFLDHLFLMPIAGERRP